MPQRADDAGGGRRSIAQTVFAMFVVISLLIAAIGAPVVRGEADLNANAGLDAQLRQLGVPMPGGPGNSNGAPGQSPGPGTPDGNSLFGNRGSTSTTGTPGQTAGQERTGDQSGDSRFGALKPGQQSPIGSQGQRIGRTAPNAQRNQSNQVHLTYQSPTPLYLRTAAYSRYTGVSFVRAQSPRPFTGAVGGGEYTTTATTRTYTVRLAEPATAVPHTWRLTRIKASDRPPGDLQTTADGELIAATGAFPAGTTFTLQSSQPPAAPDRLAAARGPDPAPIERRYTQLPRSLPSRVGDRTDAIFRAANADTRYQKAVAIERYLEQNKEYSLQARHPSRGAVVDTFLFEMERGYCEYFAATMAVMLRTDGIPTRFVTGYAPGERGDGQYVVKAKHAHAWVEVYFQDVGWVRFDPTPPAGREGADRRASPQDRPPEQVSTPGSPSNQLADRRATQRTLTNQTTQRPTNLTALTNSTANVSALSNRTITKQVTTESGAQYRISVPRPVVPGTETTVTVRQDAVPAPGVAVRVNGAAVGVTNDSGQVPVTVPYTSQLNVTITPDDDRDGATAQRRVPAPPPLTSPYQYDAALPTPTSLLVNRPSHVPPEAASAGVPAANTTVPVATNASVTTTGPAVPGTDITVAATVADVPLADATVRVNGERVATTTSTGNATVTVPPSATGTLTVSVARGPVTGQTTVQVTPLNISVAAGNPTGLPLPTQPATITVTASGDPVSGAAVTVNGARVGRTAADGTVTTTTPVAAEIAVTATAQTGATARTTTLTALVPALIAAVIAVAALVAAGYLLAARRDVLRRLAKQAREAYERARAIIAALPDKARAVAARVRDRLVNAVYRASTAIVAAAKRVPAALVALSVPGLLAALRGVAARLWAVLVGVLTRSRSADATQQAAADAASADPGGTGPQPGILRRAWRLLLRAAGLSRTTVRTATPADVAERATSAGLPPEDVRTITDTFRDAMYGPDHRAPAQARRTALVTAAQSLAEYVDDVVPITISETDQSTATTTDDATSGDSATGTASQGDSANDRTTDDRQEGQ